MNRDLKTAILCFTGVIVIWFALAIMRSMVEAAQEINNVIYSMPEVQR